MNIEIKPLHYGHSDGHTDITYSSDGERLISCGGDGDVRIWNGFEDDDPFQTCLGEYVLCTKHKGEHLIVGADNNKVQLVQFPNGERDGILTRFTAQVNHIATSSAHNWVAIASEDMTIQVIEMESKSIKKLGPLKGPILSISIDAVHKYVAASCGDGNLIIMDINTQNIIKEFPVVPKTNSFEHAQLLCRTDFDDANKYFAYPSEFNIILLNVDGWSKAFSLSYCEKITSAYSIVAFSSSNNYLAASTLEGDIVVWNVQTQTVAGYLKHPKDLVITAIAWNPKDNGELAFSDTEGYIGLAVNCCNSNATGTALLLESAQESNGLDADDNIEANLELADDDDEDNENAVSIEKLKREIMGSDMQLDDDDKASVQSPSPRLRSPTPEPPLQAAFQPSSTPEHLDPRYMCWNEIGVIRCYGSRLEDDEEGVRSIEVEFHDSTLHSSMMMSNFHGYTMGSISSAALAVASPNSINVIPLTSSSKEWTLSAPAEDEEIIALATSHNLICFGTNRHFIHVCTIYGIQKSVMAIPGPIICMNAFGHVLMVAYHASGWRKGDQCVDVMLVKLEGMSIESRDLKSALGPETCVQWIGFTDVGTPAMMDSNGMLFLHPLQSNVWLPFCNTKTDARSRIDGFFLTAVYESLCTVRGIKCRGSQYPGFIPMPTLSELELQPPFFNMDTEKHQLEANIYKWSTLQVENTGKKLKETALKAFALSAKNNFDERALELMEVLQNSSVLTLALKYVNKLGKNRLSEKLSELASKVNRDDDLDLEEQVLAEVSTPSNVIKPNRKLVLSSSGKILNKSKVSTPTNTPSSSIRTQDLISSPLATVSSQLMPIPNDESRNPFLKSLKKPKAEAYNPLSLTDKFAGYSAQKENKTDAETATTEKRKLSDTTPADKGGKEKQRKLDMFMFTKHT